MVTIQAPIWVDKCDEDMEGHWSNPFTPPDMSDADYDYEALVKYLRQLITLLKPLATSGKPKHFREDEDPKVQAEHLMRQLINMMEPLATNGKLKPFREDDDPKVQAEHLMRQLITLMEPLATSDKPDPFREDDDEVEDGSLPCSEMNSDIEMSDDESEDSGCPAGYGVLANDTRQLITRFLMEHTGLSKSSRWKESKPLATMKRVVEGVLEKHRYAYNRMVRKMSLDDRGDAEFVRSVAQNLFADGTTNWARIVSLVALGAAVSQYQKENGKGDFVEMVGEELSSYLLSEQREWLVKNNSWDGFVEFFRVADPESTVRNTLMAVAGFAGIGATLALLIR